MDQLALALMPFLQIWAMGGTLSSCQLAEYCDRRHGVARLSLTTPPIPTGLQLAKEIA